MKLFQKTSALLLLILTLACHADKCFAQKYPMTVEAGVIPLEFNKNNDTLLISSGNPFYNISMKKHFRKSYTGEYKVVKDADNYSTQTCRYILYEGTTDTHIKTIHPDDSKKNTSHDMIGHGSFSIYDRLANKSYINNYIASPKLIKEYIEALDAARK